MNNLVIARRLNQDDDDGILIPKNEIVEMVDFGESSVLKINRKMTDCELKDLKQFIKSTPGYYSIESILKEKFNIEANYVNAYEEYNSDTIILDLDNTDEPICTYMYYNNTCNVYVHWDGSNHKYIELEGEMINLDDKKFSLDTWDGRNLSSGYPNSHENVYKSLDDTDSYYITVHDDYQGTLISVIHHNYSYEEVIDYIFDECGWIEEYEKDEYTDNFKKTFNI